MGQKLIASLKEAVKYIKDTKKLRTSTMEIPEPAPHWRKEHIVQLRKRSFQMSQPVFAALLSVTASTVRAWEQGLKSPSGAACRLLELAEFEPEVFLRLARERHGFTSRAHTLQRR